LLTAAPQLAKAAAAYRRNVATVRRACSPRRGPGPWRSDREVLEEGRRAVEFVQKMYDAYAEAWADQPLEKNLGEATAAEIDRWLAWTQLDRYAEMASAPPAPKKSAAPSAAAGHGGQTTQATPIAAPDSAPPPQQPSAAESTAEPAA
jgi:hypothetical protein